MDRSDFFAALRAFVIGETNKIRDIDYGERRAASSPSDDGLHGDRAAASAGESPMNVSVDDDPLIAATMGAMGAASMYLSLQ